MGLNPDVFFFNLRPAHWAKDPRAAWLPTAEFRKAISHAVDREAYANTVFLGAAVPVHGPVSPGNKDWFWPDLPRYQFNRATAQELLQGLGLANRDADAWLEDAAGAEARFTVLTYRGNTALERGAQVLKESLEQVGIAVDVVSLETGALIERMLSGGFDAIFFNMVNTDTDPAMQRDFWLSSGSAHIWNIGQKSPATDWERQIDELMTRAGRVGGSGRAHPAVPRGAARVQRTPPGAVFRRPARLRGGQRAPPQPRTGPDAAAAAVERRHAGGGPRLGHAVSA